MEIDYSLIKMLIYRYTDCYQNVYWFREDPRDIPKDVHRYYGIILKVLPGFAENINKSWKVGHEISVLRGLSVEEEDKNILKEIFCHQ